MSYQEISATYPKGKRDYVCEWCGQKIPRGEKHLSRAYKFCDDFKSARMHLECEQAMHDTPDYDLEDGWSFGSNERPQPTNPQHVDRKDGK